MCLAFKYLPSAFHVYFYILKRRIHVYEDLSVAGYELFQARIFSNYFVVCILQHIGKRIIWNYGTSKFENSDKVFPKAKIMKIPMFFQHYIHFAQVLGVR